MHTQMDALGAFSYLADNLPSWMTRLSDLTAHTATKHAEFAEAFKKRATTPVKQRRRRNSSVCSIQTQSQRSGSQGRSRRKRGADDGDISSLDSGEGPNIVSRRHNLIIHYDGYTQKSLEEMVRNIGTARNNMRKGKMSEVALPGFRSRTPNARSRSPLPMLDSDVSEDQLLATIRSARSRGPPAPQLQPQGRSPRESPFDLADRHLELAHNLCETAAYNFLRAGDCSRELTGVKDKFTILLKLATEEVQRLKQEQMNESDNRKSEKPAEDTSRPASLKRRASSEEVIEVDDESVSIESIDLAAFRVSRIRR